MASWLWDLPLLLTGGTHNLASMEEIRPQVLIIWVYRVAGHIPSGGSLADLYGVRMGPIVYFGTTRGGAARVTMASP